ncbi:MAG: UvrD-helicase domain-containing protein [Pseudomonadota bacterium]
MRIGERVKHIGRPDLGIGELVQIYGDGSCQAVFPDGASFSGISLNALISGEEEFRQTQELSERKRREEDLQRIAEEEARVLLERRRNLLCNIQTLLDRHDYAEADRYYSEQCVRWLDRGEYDALVTESQFIDRFVEINQTGSLAALDEHFHTRPKTLELTVEDFVAIKIPKVRKTLATLAMPLDKEQEHAIARPERRVLIKARAGSGKTRSLCAQAALAIKDEHLDPNQVLILAFNGKAAEEVGHRVRTALGIMEYKNARTFHSLAHQLVKPKKKPLSDGKGDPSETEQSRFMQSVMQRILNPAFKEKMVEFFRQELNQIEEIGRDLPPQEYCAFRRSLECVALNGALVKSNGEKFIADFLFEHDIQFEYERGWKWKTPKIDGARYWPDFTILANGKDYILEHWAINLDDLTSQVPQYFDMTTAQYRLQARTKQTFWAEKNVPLLETHSGLMAGGRAAFEVQLRSILEGADIRCVRLPQDEIVRRVFVNDFAISRMTKLFLQFVRRTKQRGRSVDEAARHIAENPDNEPRTRLFHELALRAFSEYEGMLIRENRMDFDDLLTQAALEVRKLGASASIHLGDGIMLQIRDLRWILLDEYQDFSELYFRLLQAIIDVNPCVRLVAVGDDWQAINAFAGAELRFFDRFSDYFLGAESVDVTTNYRSDRAVVAAGNQLMKGCGAPSKVKSSAPGMIKILCLDDFRIEFQQGDEYREKREADSLFLPLRPDGKGPSDYAVQQARGLKACFQVLRHALSKDSILETISVTKGKPYAMLLARSNHVYGLKIEEFRLRLIEILANLNQVEPKYLERLITVSTAHRSKGQEAHTVIILDASRKQFPKIHPDNLLFGLFGVTPQAVLEEERRLFYVAMTRAKHNLFMVTGKKREESPFLDALKDSGAPDQSSVRTSRMPEIGELARKIQARIEAASPNAFP